MSAGGVKLSSFAFVRMAWAMSSVMSCLFLKCQYRAGAWTLSFEAMRLRVTFSRPLASKISMAAFMTSSGCMCGALGFLVFISTD